MFSSRHSYGVLFVVVCLGLGSSISLAAMPLSSSSAASTPGTEVKSVEQASGSSSLPGGSSPSTSAGPHVGLISKAEATAAVVTAGAQLSVSQSTLAMQSTGTAAVTLKATTVGGVTFPANATGSKMAVLSGLPAGMTATWSKATLVSSTQASWTLTLVGSNKALASSETLTLQATIEGTTGTVYTTTQTVKLTVALTAPTLTLSPALTAVPLVRGLTATDAFTFTGGGSFNGNVTLSVSGLPTGVTGSWSSSTVSMSTGSGTSTLHLAATTTAAVNWFTFTVTATGDGLTVSKSYTVMVQQAPTVQIGLQSSLWMWSMNSSTITVTGTPMNGLVVPAGAVGATAQIVSGLPAGITSTWSAPTLTAAGVVSWTLTLTGSVNAVASTGPVTVAVQIPNATTGIFYGVSQSMALTVALTAPTLAIAPAQTQVSMGRSASGSNALALTTGGSFHGNVTLAVSGLPTGVSGAFSSNAIPLSAGTGAASGTSTLTVSTNSSVAYNWYTVTVTATSDGLTVSKTFTLIVQQTVSGGISMQFSQANIWMWSMLSTSTTVTATPTNGMTASTTGAAVSIASGLPTGVTASFSQPTVSSSGVSWTLTLTGSVYALAGTDTINVATQLTNSSTGVVYTASKSLSLQVDLTAPTMSMASALNPVPVYQGASATDTITLTTGGSFHGNITLAITGLPSGVTGSWSNSTVTPTPGTAATTTSTLILTASPTATVNWFPFTVTATGDGLTSTKSYTVEVTPSVGVLIQLAQPTVAIPAKGTSTLLVTAVPQHGIVVAAGAVGATPKITSTLPSGVTTSWSQPTLTSSGTVTWTLTLNSDGTPQPGNDAIGVSVQITDKTSGLTYSSSQNFSLLVSLLANVSVGSTPGNAISPNFMGISQEWIAAQSVMGNSTTGVNTIFRQLLTNLGAYGAGPFNVRIGGNSTDTSGEPTSSAVEPFAELARTLGAHFNLGVNLGSDNANLAADQAKAFLNQMPAGSVDALEVGNEPDLYYKNGMRSSSYTVQDYFADFSTWRATILPVVPTGTKLMGTAWASTGMLGNLSTFEGGELSELGAFSQHYYAALPSANPAADFLLAPATATTAPAQVASAVATSHANGIPFRMGETNSLGDGGIHGISDAFGAALWSVDTMFEYANVGVDGVNWETGNGDYVSPFAFNSTTAGNKTTFTLSAVNGLYYGMLLFQAATPKGAQLLPVILNTQANLKAWATVDGTGTQRVILINKDEANSGTVSITMPGYSQVSVLRMTAPSYSSTTGIQFAGQTFDGSTDGTIQGTQTVQTLTGTNGVFQVSMPTVSAALLIFSE